MSNAKKQKIVIVGAGTGGISTAARILEDHPEREWDIVIIDPSDKHYYQPLFTLVGAGVFDAEESSREQKDYIPCGATWLKQAVKSFDPEIAY